MQEYEGQNNVGIISLNTFRVMPIEVNRYEQGQLIEENTGCLQMQTHKDPDEGFSAYLYIDADRGTATGNISFNGDQEMDLSNAAQHLCEEHFREFAESLYKSAYGVGIVSFENKKLKAFCDEVISFQSGDYYIDSYFIKKDPEIAEHLNLGEDAVFFRRSSTIQLLKKILDGMNYER